MRPKVEVQRIDHGWKAFQERMKELTKQRPHVKVGVIGRQAEEVHPSEDGKGTPITNVQLALIQEFGTERIPERSFIRGTFRIHREEYQVMLARVLKLIVDGKLEVQKGFSILGLKVQGDMQTRIADRGAPEPWVPNADSTIAMKGSDVPLVDTGRLRQSISFEVVTG